MNFGNSNGMTPPPPMGNFGAPAPMGAPAPAPMGGAAPAPMGGAGVVNLSKGQKVNLSKVAPSLTRMMVGLGWDVNKYSGGKNFDLDASAFLCDANNKCKPENFIFYNNMHGPNESVVHQGDNRTGEGEGDDEQIFIDLTKIPSDIVKIAITVTIDQAEVKKQSFGQVENAFIRLVNADTNEEVLRYDLSEDFGSETVLVFAEIYKHNGDWKFNAIGSGFYGDPTKYKTGFQALCANYGIDADYN